MDTKVYVCLEELVERTCKFVIKDETWSRTIHIMKMCMRRRDWHDDLDVLFVSTPITVYDSHSTERTFDKIPDECEIYGVKAQGMPESIKKLCKTLTGSDTDNFILGITKKGAPILGTY